MRLVWPAAALFCLTAVADAQVVEPDPAPLLVSVGPIGPGASIFKTPANVQSVTEPLVNQTPDISAADALDQRIGSIGLDAETGNPYQPSLTYRGFDASPVTGESQGVAVYQDGVRLNEAFGDTVNWDMIPTFAIANMDVGGGNPAFGLNAIGGAIAIRMKDGFGWQGLQTTLSGGSFGNTASSLQYGKHVGSQAVFVAIDELHDDGFRQASGSNIRRAYGNFAYKFSGGDIHIDVGGADNSFGATGVVPIQMLQKDWSSVYTTPQTSSQSMGMLNMRGSFRPSADWSLDGNVYLRSFTQKTVDGNTTSVQACADPTLLCYGDAATPAVGLNGTQLPNVNGGAALGEIDETRTRTTTSGASIQATNSDRVGGLTNQFRLGASVGYSTTHFSASSEIGVMQPDLSVVGSGVFLGASGTPISIGPVSLETTRTDLGAWASDTIDVNQRLSFIVGARANVSQGRLHDLLGGALTGASTFSHVDPNIGATFKFTSNLSGYVGWSESNRAPTPLELGCADPRNPCAIASFLVSDPPLKQVVGRTLEAGLRGSIGVFDDKARVLWKAGVFRTDLADDIMDAPSAVQGFGYFANVGATRRQGFEGDVSFESERFSAHLAYTYLDATFRNALTLSSPNNPNADASGQIQVQPGDQIPMIPRQRLKLGGEWSLNDKIKSNIELVAVSPQVFAGDAANLNPRLPGWAVVDVGGSYQATKQLAFFIVVDNLFDRRYATYGDFYDTNAVAFLTLSDPRTLSPARPRSFVMGARASF